MPVGKIAVVRVALATLVADLQPAKDVAAPFDGPEWAAYRGHSGGTFFARAAGDATLVVPFGIHDTLADLAVALRGLLGAALDHHDDARGVFVAGGDPPSGHYDELVAGAGSWAPVIATDDSALGLAKDPGWSFAAAAKGLFAANPGAKDRADERAEIDPLASAAARLDDKLAQREDRGALRRSLSAALEHSIEHSALGAFTEPEKPREEGEEGALDEAADKLRRALGANPDKVTHMENALRKAVDEEIARAGEVDAKDPPAPAVVTVDAEKLD